MNSSLSSCKGFAFRHLSKTAVSIFSTIFLNAAYVEATLANTDIDSENVSSVFSAGSINPLWDHGLHSYLAYAQADTGQPKVRVCETPLSANQADVQENTSVNPLFEYSSDASCGVSELSGEAGQLFKFTSATQLTDDQGFNPYVFETGMSITVQDSLDFSAFSNGVLRLEVLGSPSQSTNILISLNDNVGEDEFGNNGNHLSLLYTLESEIEYRVIEIDLESWLSENINFDIAQVDAISLTNFGELTLKSIEFVQQTQDSSGGNGSEEVSDGEAHGSSTDGSFSVPDFVGNWTLYQGPGALGVGPYPGDTSWWSIDTFNLSERDCLFDDIYSFGSDGSFSVIQDGLTWVEAWQGVSNTALCGSPVYPHDGSNPASFIYDEAAQTITLSGIGAYIGLPGVADGIPELSDPSQAPESITYNIVAKSANSMTLEIASSGSVYWTFKLVRAGMDGSTDGSSSADSVEMVDGFGGALVDGETFTYPAGAEAWAGFANLNTAVYPFTFANGGSITFTAAVAAGGSDTNVYFRFERLPYPDVDPSFNLDPVLIVGETEMEYTVTIPAQDATNTYASFLLYLVEQDQTVIIRDIVVTDDSGSTDSAGGETTGGGSNDADPVISTVTVFDNGVVGSSWDGDIVAWDAFLPGTCINDGGAGCPSIDWTLVSDNERGDVLQVSHSDEGHFASLIFSSHLSPQDLSAFSQGSLVFDIKVLSGDSNISIELLCVLPCRTSVIPIESNDLTDWETVSIPVERLVAEGLDLRSVDTGLIIFATNYTGTVFQLDNIRWELSSNGGSIDGGNADDDASDGGSTDSGSTDGGSTDGGFSSPPLNIFSDGAVDPFWDSGINGYDSSIDWQECNNDGGQACPNIDWQIVSDDYRGDVLMVSHTGNQVSTGLYIGASSVQDLSAYAGGYFIYDIKIVAAGDNSLVSSRVNCWYPCTSGSMGVGTLEGDWKTEKIPVDFLVETGLDLSAVSSLVFDLTDDGDQNVVILLDKIRFEAANVDGSTDDGTTDGFTDGGTTDGGSVDGGANEVASIEMIEGFGGAIFDEASSSYTVPTGSEVWAGFANLNIDVYPFTFANGGSISFTAALPAGGSDTSVYFRFERRPYPDSDPSFNLDPVVISGSEQEYTVTVPAQDAENTYESFLMYLVEQDSPVIIKNIVVTDNAEPDSDGSDSGTPASAAGYKAIPFGAGSVSDTINSASYRCVVDYGNWIYNAGVVEPGIDGCDGSSGVPSGTPTPLLPQITGEALNRPIPTHKWWGSVPFVGEMTVGDSSKAAYITPDPIRARISNTGARVSGIPSSFKSLGNFPRYDGPAPFDEVFEGVAIANSVFSDMDAFLKDHSDGSVTVQWKSGTTEVMDATFVHGSPYVYFKIHQGNALLRTLREDGGEKGTFYNQGNHLGIWTNIAGIRNNILLSGEGITTYSNISSNEITINNDSNEFTLTYLPELSGNVSDSMTSDFAAKARNKVASVEIGYTVDRSTNTVTVNHAYLDAQGNAADTIVGMHPLHWKNSDQATSAYKVRSARGMIKFATTDGFSYDLPFTGVLPTMPSISGSFDQATLEALVTSFVNAGESEWYNSTDTYWSGKGYGKVAETAALAQSIGMEDAAAELIAWLKVELVDWFTAETDGELDINKYFVYDETWDALLGIEEAYGSHQRMADHHFHYGYFVRAAAEICRVDVAWCGDDQYGPMIELLIRDYAGDDSEEMFPKMRNFDPANGFSWADGKGDTIQGNNNESTSEAANAYGAMVLYGLAVGNDAIVEKGMYMHASTSAAFWQYWNNIDGYNNLGADYDNFAPGYDKITTSIIWGSGADFSTWFSPAYAHILGIQGLPSNPLILYVGQYADYMESYVELGMTESSNGNPSGLAGDQWTDLWWNLWAMTDADAALADYNSVGTNYDAEAGESKAHTYHWLHTFKALGHLKTGTGELTANDASALAFDKDGLRTYVVYNFSDQSKAVTYSDGRIVNALANSFTIKTSDDPQGSLDSDSDGGATDGSDAEVSDIIDMTGSFGGAALQGSTYSFPAGSEVWAGFANLNTDVYPFTFASEGSITFTASADVDTSVYFRFEKLPHPDTEPSFNLDPVLISGAKQEYTVTIPAQDAANTYESFLMYVVDQDQAVTVKNIVVTHDGGTTGVPVEADYVEPSSPGIEIINDASVTADWGGDASLSFKACGTCAEISTAVVSDDQRGDVLQISYSDNAGHAVLEILSTGASVDVSAFTELSFDIKILNIGPDVGFNLLAKSSTSLQIPVDISPADSSFWQTFTVPVSALNAVDSTDVTAPFIFFPDVNKGAGLVYQIDDVRWQ
jgi:endo-1,3(4)-beta-glucanase